MKIYKFKKAGFAAHGMPIKKGDELVLADGYTEYVKEQIEEGQIDVRDLNDVHEHYNNQDLNGKSLLIFRFGGYGDILFCTPLVRYLRKKYPDAKIHFACGNQYKMIWRGNKDISRFGIHDYPVTWQLLKQFDYHLHFDGVIEGNPQAEKINAYDLFLNEAGIDCQSIDTRNKVPVYEPDPYALNKVRNYLRYELGIDPDKDQIIAVQARASSAVRTLDPKSLMEIIFKLAKLEEYKVLIIGARMDFPLNLYAKNIYKLTGSLKMLDSVALLKYCKLVIAPDSSMVHFAAAIGVPCLSIYGPFPADLRIRYYPLCKAIEPPDDPDKCWPCFCHDHVCPKVTGQRILTSPCLKHEQIPGELIYRTVKSFLNIIERGTEELGSQTNTKSINNHTDKRSTGRIHETVSA